MVPSLSHRWMNQTLPVVYINGFPVPGVAVSAPGTVTVPSPPNTPLTVGGAPGVTASPPMDVDDWHFTETLLTQSQIQGRYGKIYMGTDNKFCS